jgi:hypothetical protein
LIRSCETGQSIVLTTSDKVQTRGSRAQHRTETSVFWEYSRNIWDYLYTNFQAQGCSVKGDIRCCKIERDNQEVESRLSLKTCQTTCLHISMTARSANRDAGRS